MSEPHIHFKSLDDADWIIVEKDDEETWELISLSGAFRARFDGLYSMYTKDDIQVTLTLELAGHEMALVWLSKDEYHARLAHEFGEPNESENVEVH